MSDAPDAVLKALMTMAQARVRCPLMTLDDATYWRVMHALRRDLRTPRFGANVRAVAIPPELSFTAFTEEVRADQAPVIDRVWVTEEETRAFVAATPGGEVRFVREGAPLPSPRYERELTQADINGWGPGLGTGSGYGFWTPGRRS